MSEAVETTAEVVIRDAGPDDCGRLAALLIDTYAYYGSEPPVAAPELVSRLRRHLGGQPGFEALLAECDGNAVGFAIYAPVFWTSDCQIGLFLKEIFVLSSHRGRGIGRALMTRLAHLASQREWTRIVWTVDRRNRAAMHFYEALPGAREVNKHVYMLSGAALRRFAEET